MLVIDTSAWIEIYLDSVAGRRSLREMPGRTECLIPTIVQFELAKWLAREVSEDLAQVALVETMESVIVPLDTALALHAAEVSSTHKLAMADAIIYATAQAHGAELLTCDAHFEGLPNVRYIAKTGT